MNFKDLKIGDVVDKKEFGIVDFFEGNPRVVEISYHFYDDKTGTSAKISFKSKDYDELFEDEDEE